jgi:hypothetical protein
VIGIIDEEDIVRDGRDRNRSALNKVSDRLVTTKKRHPEAPLL